MERLSPVNCRGHIYTAPCTPQRLPHSGLLFTAVLSRIPTTLCPFSPASSARDNGSFSSPSATPTFPQFTNSPKIRSLSHGWPTSPWVVLSSRYVLGHLTSGVPNSTRSSACFRCLFERKFVFFGPQWTDESSQGVAVYQRSCRWNDFRGNYRTALCGRVRPSWLGT